MPKVRERIGATETQLRNCPEGPNTEDKKEMTEPKPPSDDKGTGPTIEIRKAKPGEMPEDRLTLTVHPDTDKERTMAEGSREHDPIDESKPITAGLCWVRAREIESSGAYQINPNRGHVAETPHDGDEWSLPVYRCRLCGCLFSPDAKDPKASG